MSVRRKLGHGLGLALSTLALTGVAAPAAQAQADPSTCTQDIQFDPGVRTWDQVFPNSPIAGNNSTGVSQKHLTQDLYTYAQAVMADVANSPRVRILERDIGPTVLGKRLKYYILGTPGNVANLDAGRDDGAFWRGVITGEVSAAEALTQVRARPAFAWITATPHGNEPAAGEAISRQLYELAARTDCHNIERLDNLTLFLDPARNPDGRDANSRYTAWGFDGNRDFGTRNQPENRLFMPEINKYPGLFFIDAHQNTGSYFFPPNEDPGPPRDLAVRAGLHPAPDRPRDPAEVQRSEHQLPQLQHLRPLHAGVRGHGPGAVDGLGGHDLRAADGRRLRPPDLPALPGHRHDDQRDLARQGPAPHRLDQAVAGGDRPRRGLQAAGEQARQPAAHGHRAAAERHRLRLLLQAGPAFGRRGQADARPAEHRRQRLPARPGRDRRQRRAPLRAGWLGDRHAAGRHALDPDGAAAEALDPGRPRRGAVRPVPVLL